MQCVAFEPRGHCHLWITEMHIGNLRRHTMAMLQGSEDMVTFNPCLQFYIQACKLIGVDGNAVILVSNMVWHTVVQLHDYQYTSCGTWIVKMERPAGNQWLETTYIHVWERGQGHKHTVLHLLTQLSHKSFWSSCSQLDHPDTQTLIGGFTGMSALWVLDPSPE